MPGIGRMSAEANSRVESPESPGDAERCAESAAGGTPASLSAAADTSVGGLEQKAPKAPGTAKARLSTGATASDALATVRAERGATSGRPRPMFGRDPQSRPAASAMDELVIHQRTPFGGRTSFIVGLFLITALGTGLRIHRLGDFSLFADELYTIRDAAQLGRLPKAKLLGYLPTSIGLRLSGADLSRVDPARPETWQGAGASEFRARVGSCLIGILTIPLFVLILRGMVPPTAALMAGLLLAISPWHLLWSHAARFYTQQFLFYTLALVGYYVGTRNGQPRWTVAAMVAMALAGLSQPTAMVIVGVLAVDWVVATIRGCRPMLGRSGWTAGAIACVVVVGAMAYDAGERAHIWTQFNGHSYHGAASLMLGTAFMVNSAIVVAAVAAAAGLLRSDTRVIVFLLAAATVPPLVFAILAQSQYVGLRYAFVCLPGWLILAALGCARLYETIRPRLGRALAAAPFAILAVSLAYRTFEYERGADRHRPAWRPAFEYVKSHRAAGDVVIADPWIGPYYLQEPVMSRFPRQPEDLTHLSERTWIVMEVRQPVGGRNNAWLDEGAQLKWYHDFRTSVPFSSVRVYLHDPSSRRLTAAQPATPPDMKPLRQPTPHQPGNPVPLRSPHRRRSALSSIEPRTFGGSGGQYAETEQGGA